MLGSIAGRDIICPETQEASSELHERVLRTNAKTTALRWFLTNFIALYVQVLSLVIFPSAPPSGVAHGLPAMR